jgi:putative ABC transport system substrate-binding protein
LNKEMAAKRLETLHELVPTVTVMALLVNPTDPAGADAVSSEILSAARSLGLELHVLNASNERDFDAVFVSLTKCEQAGSSSAVIHCSQAGANISPRCSRSSRRLLLSL